jgi:hypothetical protein
MAMVILLSAAEAEEVRGPSALHLAAALNPLPLTDGRFYLAAGVVDDPLHGAHQALLASLPQADYSTLAGLLPPEALSAEG